MGKVHFTEERSTMPATLYGTALDNRSDDPIPPPKTRCGASTTTSPSSAWAPIDPAESVRWFDVDYPDVIDLRKQIYPERENHSLVSSSVTDLAWLDDIPADRPTLVVAEGLTMYLDPSSAEKLLRTMAERFPRGQMIFDLYGRLGIKLQKLNPIVRRAGATLTWGVDDPRELERLGLTVVACLDGTDFATPEIVAKMSKPAKLQLRLAKSIPAVRRMGHIVRYEF